MNTHATLSETISLPHLERQPMEPRALKSIILSAITIAAAITACIPLFSVLIMLIYRGGKRLSLEIFYALPPTAFEMGGGFGNAILGTLFMVGLASLISVPFGFWPPSIWPSWALTAACRKSPGFAPKP